jgi:hypothetical protein
MKIHELYQSKEKRDARYKELKKQGHDLIKRSSSNQLTHPQYIKDFEGPEKYDTGFGNTVYKTYFAKLYAVETKPEWMKN